MPDDVRTRGRLDLASRQFFEDQEEQQRRPLPRDIQRSADRFDAFVDRNRSFLERHRKTIAKVVNVLARPWPALQRSGMQGAMWGHLERGEYADALDVALRGCERSLTDKRGLTPDDPHDDYWSFMEGACTAASELGDPSSWSRVWWAASKPFLPIEGYCAAYSMLVLSQWREPFGHRDDAVRTARWSVGADPTWALPSIWAARLGVRGAPFDAERMLRDALAIDERAKERIFNDEEFASVPGLLAALERPRLRVSPRA